MTSKGSAVPPAGQSANLAYFRHIASWQNNGGRWKQESARDDHLDCRKYSLAMMLLHEKKAEQKQEAEKREEDRPALTPVQEMVQQKPQNGYRAPAYNWITDG